MPLIDCFKQAGKALDQKDREAIESLVADGRTEEEAVLEHISSLDAELEGIANRAEGEGAEVEYFQPAKDVDKTETEDLVVTHNLSEENLKHVLDLGGLAAPSLAIQSASKGFKSFGEISLLANPNVLVDPDIRTFDADVYTPRQPRPEFDINEKQFSAWMNSVEVPEGLDLPKSYKLEDGPNRLLSSEALQYHFLKAKGKPVKTKKMKVDSEVTLGVKAAKKAGVKFDYLIRDLDEVKKLADKRAKRRIKETLDKTEGEVDITDRFYREDGELDVARVDELARNIQAYINRDGVDTYALREDISKKMRNKKLSDEYAKYIESKFNSLIEGKRIFKGFTPSGNRKYADYTLANVVKEMTKKVQGGEDFNYGAGSIRANYAKEYETIGELQKDRDRIVTDKEFQELKDESNEKLSDLLDYLRPYYKYDSNSWNYMNDASAAIAEGPKGLREAFDLDAESKKQINEFIDYLRSMPTSYFEAKVGRAMQLSEFHTAVVPRGVSKETVQALKDAGLKIKRYDSKVEGDRARVTASQSKLLFQEKDDKPRGGIFITETETVIKLAESSDLSTFLHETGHLFLEMESRFAKEFGINKKQQDLLDWLGVDSFESIQVEQHEKFARAFEAYLREGQAPSSGLQAAFDTFSRWLKHIYRSLTSLDVELDNDIRSIFDRLLATEAEMEAMKANPAYAQFFRSKEQAGMTDAEWKAYQEQAAKAESKSQLTLDQKVLKELRDRATKEWWKEKRPLIAEEKERISKLTPYQILADAKQDKMNLQELMELLDVEKVQQMPGRLIGKYVTDGVSPYEYAEVYGYDSAEQMLDDILTVEPLNKAAEKAAEERMIQMHGDILNDGSIEAEARNAVHNEEQAKLLLQELQALKRKTKSDTKIDRDYLKNAAKKHIKNLKYKEIKPNRFYRNEMRAAKKAVTATTDEARLEAKIQQVANHYLYTEALNTRDAMTKDRKIVRGFQTREYKPTVVEGNYAAKIKSLARMYDLRNPKAREIEANKILDWYEGQLKTPDSPVDVQLLDPNLVQALDIRTRNAANQDKQPIELKLPTFDDLTADDLRGVRDMLEHLRFLGRELSDTVKAERAAKREKFQKSVLERGGRDVKTTPGIDEPFKRTKRNVSELFNAIPSLRNLVRKLDGFSETDDGVAYDLVYRPVEDSNSRKIETSREMYDRYEAELKDIHKVGLNNFDSKRYQLESGSTLDINPEARFMMAMYWGTETSRDAIRDGFGVTDRDVETILSDMTTDQINLVNATWKVNESMWPELSKASVEQYGVAPPKLEPTPFSINGIRMTGGHQRLFYDSIEIELKSEQEQTLAMKSIIPSKAGSLHARVGSGGRAPNLSLTNISRAIEDNIHFIAFAPAGAELRNIVNAKDIRATIIQKHGEGFYLALVNTIEGITSNRMKRESFPFLPQMFRLLRRAATAKHLMYSIRNTVQQVTAIPIAMDEVGLVPWLEKLQTYASPTHHKDFKEFVDQRSKFMQNRGSLVNREAAEFLRQINTSGRFGHMWNTYARLGFTPQTIVDSVIAYPVWMAKYEKALAEHGDEAKAASQADTAVAESVGSGSDLHLGGAFQMNNTEFVKTFTMFGSWFNAYYQRMYKHSSGFSDPINKDSLKTLLFIPWVVGTAAAAIVFDGPDNDEGWVEWSAKNWAVFLGGTMPIIRDVVSSFSGFTPTTVFSPAAEAPARTLAEITAFFEGRQTGLKAASDLTKITTTFVPVPGVGNFTRMMDYMDSYGQGKEGEFQIPLSPLQAVIEGSDKNR